MGKQTGRPPLNDHRRSKKVGARFTAAEYEEILALEKQLGLSESELIRARLLNGSTRDIINLKELVLKLDQVGAEMGRVGNNINQLARHANTLKLAGSLTPSVVIRFNELFEQYLAVQNALETCLRKIIRISGS